MYNIIERGLIKEEQNMAGKSKTKTVEVTSNDKLWAALGYPIVLCDIILLLLTDKGNRPFIKYHAIQSITVNVIFFIVACALVTFSRGIAVIGVVLLWLLLFYWALLAYQGKKFAIPVVADFIKNQGWL
jgi:uncharacterized membrane protein